jgi:hypothetical protein
VTNLQARFCAIAVGCGAEREYLHKQPFHDVSRRLVVLLVPLDKLGITGSNR